MEVTMRSLSRVLGLLIVLAAPSCQLFTSGDEGARETMAEDASYSVHFASEVGEESAIAVGVVLGQPFEVELGGVRHELVLSDLGPVDPVLKELGGEGMREQTVAVGRAVSVSINGVSWTVSVMILTDDQCHFPVRPAGGPWGIIYWDLRTTNPRFAIRTGQWPLQVGIDGGWQTLGKGEMYYVRLDGYGKNQRVGSIMDVIDGRPFKMNDTRASNGAPDQQYLFLLLKKRDHTEDVIEVRFGVYVDTFRIKRA